MTNATLAHMNKLRRLAMGAIIVTCFVGSVHSKSSECETQIQLHGFLRSALTKCRYRDDSTQEMMDTLKGCTQPLSDNEVEDLVRKGMIAFDKSFEKKGKKRACLDVLKNFPGIIRNKR